MLHGFVYSPFRARDLFDAAFGDETQPRIMLRVYDGNRADASRLLYDSRGQSERRGEPAFTQTRRLELGGRVWTVVIQSTRFFELGSRSEMAPVTAAVGLSLSLALFFLVRAQAQSRAAAEQVADEIRRSAAQRRAADAALQASNRRTQHFDDWLHFLSDASGVLGSSLDYETTLQSITKLSVPRIADVCAVHIVDEQQALQHLALEHADSGKRELLRAHSQRFSFDPNAALGPAYVVRGTERANRSRSNWRQIRAPLACRCPIRA